MPWLLSSRTNPRRFESILDIDIGASLSIVSVDGGVELTIAAHSPFGESTTSRSAIRACHAGILSRTREEPVVASRITKLSTGSSASCSRLYGLDTNTAVETLPFDSA